MSSIVKSDILKPGVSIAPAPIGSVQQSILTLTQFQSVMGLEWVLMDGADVTGSSLALLTGNNLLPDATGRFLRSAGGSAAALNAQQTEATAKNGLANATSNVSNITANASTVSGGSWSLSGTAAGQGGGATNSGYTQPNVNNYDNTATWQITGSAGASQKRLTGFATDAPNRTKYMVAQNHRHSMPSHTHSASSVSGSASRTGNSTATAQVISDGLAAAQVLSGDVETRPVNITVNTFIKIN